MGLFDLFTGTKRPKAGTPTISETDLRTALMAINRDTAPWQIRLATPQDKCDLVVEWRIVEPSWTEIFAKAGTTRVFKVLLKFDAGAHEVRAVDQEWSVTWSTGLASLSLVIEGFRGQKTEVSFGGDYAFTETRGDGQTHSYRFSAGELKTPVQEAIMAAGWTYRAVAFGKL